MAYDWGDTFTYVWNMRGYDQEEGEEEEKEKRKMEKSRNKKHEEEEQNERKRRERWIAKKEKGKFAIKFGSGEGVIGHWVQGRFVLVFFANLQDDNIMFNMQYEAVCTWQDISRYDIRIECCP